MPTFTANYFERNIPAWELLFSPAYWKPGRPRVVIEIGSWEGQSAMWIAEHVLDAPESVLYCIDIWDLEGDETGRERLERFKANIAELPNAAQVRPIKGRSETALVKLRAQGLRADFVYIDGSHAAKDVLADLVLSFGMLKPNGLIVCDDYLWVDEANPRDVLARPKLAVDAFTTIYAPHIHLPGGFPARQLVIQKVG